MFCKNCGAQIPEGNTFCPMCGTNNAEETAANTATADATQGNVVSKVTDFVKGLGAKKIGIIAAVVVVVVVLVAICAGGSSSTGSIKVDKKGSIYVGSNYFMDADGNAKEMDDLSSVYTSMDRSVRLYTDYDGTLYLVDDKLKTEKIASDVTTVRVGRDGEYVAYLCNEDSDYYNQVLYIYSVSKKKSNKVDKDVYGDYLTISVSGESVAYIKDYDGGEFDTYIAGFSKEPTKIEKNDGRPVAVSNNGKKAYFINNDRNLYYYNGKDKEKVASDVSSSFWVNGDLSELVFTKDGSTYFCKPGKDEVKLGKSSIYSIIYPAGTSACYLGSYTEALGNDTIKGQVVYNDDGKLMWVNKKATEMIKIDSDVNSVIMSENGSAVAYVSHKKVYKVDKFKESMNQEPLYEDEDISYIVASPDLSKIYGYSYDDDDAVYYFKNSKKAEKICDDVDSVAYNPADGKLYFSVDEELYEAKTSASSKKKVSVDGDVYSVSSSVNSVLVYTRDGGDYTCYSIGKKLTKVYEDD